MIAPPPPLRFPEHLPSQQAAKTAAKKSAVRTFFVFILAIFLAVGGVFVGHIYSNKVMDSQRVGDVPEAFMNAVVNDGDWGVFVTPDSQIATSTVTPILGDAETASLLNMRIDYKLGAPTYSDACAASAGESYNPTGCSDVASIPVSMKYFLTPIIGEGSKDVTFEVKGDLKLSRPYYSHGELVKPNMAADEVGPWTVFRFVVNDVVYPDLDVSSCLTKAQTFVALSDSARIQGIPYAPCTVNRGDIITDSDVDFTVVGAEFPVMNEFHTERIAANNAGVEHSPAGGADFLYPMQQYEFATESGVYLYTFLMSENGEELKAALTAVSVRSLMEGNDE